MERLWGGGRARRRHGDRAPRAPSRALIFFFLPLGAPRSETGRVHEGSKTQAVPRRRTKECTKRFKVTPLRPQAALTRPKNVFCAIFGRN